MPRHTLKLLVLLTVFSVTPVAAGSQHHAADCPYARARAAAARSAELQPQAPARIILIERVPADTSALALESGSFPTP